MDDESVLWEETVEPGATWSHVLKRGTSLRIVDLEGAANVGANTESGVGTGGPTVTGDVARTAEVCVAAAEGAGAVEGAAPTSAPALSWGVTSPGSFTTS